MKKLNIKILLKQTLFIILLLLFVSCNNSEQKQKYKIVYEIIYPNFVLKDSLINDKHSKFDVDYFEDSYVICGDNIWILKRDKYPIIIRKIEKL